jgi:hypothetical protein
LRAFAIRGVRLEDVAGNPRRLEISTTLLHEALHLSVGRRGLLVTPSVHLAKVESAEIRYCTCNYRVPTVGEIVHRTE